MSSKIKLIKFSGADTIIGFEESYQPKDSNKVANEQTPGRKYDIPRHADLERAMDKLNPHPGIIMEFLKPVDANGNFLQKSHFDSFLADEDEERDRFGKYQVTGVLLQGKNASDGVQLLYNYTTSYGDVVKLKTPSIALKRVPEGSGYNYPLLDILDTQIDTLIHEAEQLVARKKHGAGIQTEADFKRDVSAPESQLGASDEIDNELEGGDQLDAVISQKKNGSKVLTKKEIRALAEALVPQD